MDSDERAIEAAVADFRDQLDAFEWPAPDPGRLTRATHAAGTLLSNVVGLALLAFVVGTFAAVARLGWEWVG